MSRGGPAASLGCIELPFQRLAGWLSSGTESASGTSFTNNYRCLFCEDPRSEVTATGNIFAVTDVGSPSMARREPSGLQHL